MFERMCDEECGQDQIRSFLHHIEQLEREKDTDIGRIAAVLLQAHVFIREKFDWLQVTLYQDQGRILWRFIEIFLYNI